MAVSDQPTRIKLLGLMEIIKLYLGIRLGIRKSVAVYREFEAKGNAEAGIPSLMRAIDMPNRRRARLEAAIARLGQSAISETLALLSATAMQEMNADMNALLSAAQGLAADLTNGTKTPGQIATILETATAGERSDLTLPFPNPYTDVFGTEHRNIGI